MTSLVSMVTPVSMVTSHQNLIYAMDERNWVKRERFLKVETNNSLNRKAS